MYFRIRRRRGHKMIREILVAGGVKIRSKGGRRPCGAYRRPRVTNPAARREAKGRPPEGYNLEADERERARMEALAEASTLPEWMLRLPASDRPIDPMP